MSRVRQNQENWRTAAAYENEIGSGCSSFYLLPPLAVLFFGILIAFIEVKIPMQIPNIQVSDALSSKTLAPLFTSEVQYWKADILRWSNSLNLDPNLVATIMQIESCGDPHARSPAGAMGLFQVMPYHFASSDDPFDPDTNALRGLTYLQRVYEQAGHDISWSLAAYNGGPGLLGLDAWRWPAESIRYVYWGSGIYADAARMSSTSSRLNEWLASAGAGLCREAHTELGMP